MKSILLLLPCNPGAKEGNYFTHQNWIQARQSLEKMGVKKEWVTFAAVDSIITKEDPAHDRDIKGAIVLESEMVRVKGYDLRPEWKLFRKNGYALLREHTKYCEIGLRPLISQYNLLVCALSVRGYKYAVIKALRTIGNGKLPPNCIVIDSGESPSFQNNANLISAGFIKDFLDDKPIPIGTLIVPETLHDNPKFLLRPQDLPVEFRYWDNF